MIAVSEIAGVADVLIQSDDFVFAKINNVHLRITTRRIEPIEVETCVAISYGLTGGAKLGSGTDLNYRLEAQKTVREGVSYRANATRGRVGEVADGLSMTLRFITDAPRDLTTMGIEDEILENLFPQYGLILVVGTTGSGKTTLLSAANRYRLEHRDPMKLITYEDPIENVYGRLGEGRMPKVFQAEIGTGRHLNNFHQAGPNAMRRGADVIQVGEMRDRESFEAGFELAMTGHCVYSTMHVETPAQVIDRAISLFPIDGQPAAASKLRAQLRMVVAQKQFKTLDGGMARVRSWIVIDRAVKERIGSLPYTQWERELDKICRERGGDFDAQAMPFLLSKRIDLEGYCQLTSMTPREARDYVAGCLDTRDERLAEVA
jgi:defect-in-organelle-trafficking protein DotB